nr:bifunctional folylpolyglutamate synthase/dihydrofolate synthase [Bacteroidota bacterium]
MNYTETLEYLFSRLPMYQRIGPAAYRANLDNILSFCKILDNPERKFKSVHIAGTNGKGSTSHLIASILQEAGYNTGLFTSPHYRDFRERIRINGNMMPENEVISFVEKWKNDFEKIGLSFFEMVTGMAFNYFAEENVDIAVVETGLGGRLDSTNVIHPLVSVITNIGMDHMHFLGDTPEQIATEKAGIIKTKTPVVIGENQPGIKRVFTDQAHKLQSPISFAEDNFKIVHQFQENGNDPKLNVFYKNKLYFTICQYPLKGSFQIKNLRTALQSIEEINTLGFSISEEQIKSGINNIVKNTNMCGRWQILQQKPLVICDSGHNADGINEVVKNIYTENYKTLHMVIGMVNDKDIDQMMELLPKNARYYFCKANIPRALDEKKLCLQATEIGLIGDSYETVEKAFQAAKDQSSPDDMIFIGGSTFVVAEVV